LETLREEVGHFEGAERGRATSEIRLGFSPAPRPSPSSLALLVDARSSLATQSASGGLAGPPRPPRLGRPSHQFKRTLLIFPSLAGSSTRAVRSMGHCTSYAVLPFLLRACCMLTRFETADDESFFFAPSIIGLSKASPPPQVSLLCMSVGTQSLLNPAASAQS
jgi:hypothetical protein